MFTLFVQLSLHGVSTVWRHLNFVYTVCSVAHIHGVRTVVRLSLVVWTQGEVG